MYLLDFERQLKRDLIIAIQNKNKPRVINHWYNSKSYKRDLKGQLIEETKKRETHVDVTLSFH